MALSTPADSLSARVTHQGNLAATVWLLFDAEGGWGLSSKESGGRALGLGDTSSFVPLAHCSGREGSAVAPTRSGKRPVSGPGN